MKSKIHSPLISALFNSDAYVHSTLKIELIETHISWVLLTGEFAYKIKKPVDLGFLDFSTLEKRRFFCNEELRLNLRLAPELYLAVVPITGTITNPQVNGNGTIIEYAVKMLQFPQHTQLDNILQNNQLTYDHIDALSKRVSSFHLACTVVDNQSSYGEPDSIYIPVNENFEQIKNQKYFVFNPEKLHQLLNWSNKSYQELYYEFQSRKNNLFIRECHGDMHLRNIAFWNNKILIFDCLEFDDKLRWIDVISEIAFIVMDLDERGQHNYAWHFLNAYLEQTGDYAGIAVLRFYLVYRAMVKAKVNSIEAQQQKSNKALKQQLIYNYKNYIDLALNYIKPIQPNLVIMHGFSGAGKTSLSQSILEQVSIIRLRSDIERKRLFGLDAQSKSHSVIGGNLYTKIATENTYLCLFNHAKTILQNGWSVLIDASFLTQNYRERAHQLALQNKARFIIFDCQASKHILQQRITKRIILNNDASEADQRVLKNQLVNNDNLTKDELAYTFRVNTENTTEKSKLLNQFIYHYY